MTYPYGAQGAPAVGKGLGGLPRRADLAFNEVVAAYSQDVAISTAATTDIAFPFSYGSPAELDLVVFFATNSGSDSGAIFFSGNPNGLAARIGFGTYNSSTDYRTVQLIGNVIRLTTTGTATFSGRIQILKRNRRVRNWALLPTAATESSLPFAIKDPHKAMLTANVSTQGGTHSNVFLNEYFSASDTNSWHLSAGANVTTMRAKVTSPTTYITQSATTTAVLTEFE